MQNGLAWPETSFHSYFMTDTQIRPESDGRSEILEEHLSRLQEACESILRTTPEGLSELALIKALQREPWELFGNVEFGDPALLYPVHFQLFHVLYRWRNELVAENQETIEINPLNIRLRALDPSYGTSPGKEDPLQAFYLDIGNHELPESVINRMLNDFWQGISRPDDGELAVACDTLHLDCPPRAMTTAKSQFRKLAMQHHPDRGGDTEKLQQLNHAIGIIRQYFQSIESNTGEEARAHNAHP